MAAKYLTNKDDIWNGTAGAEIVFGRGGNDWLFGKEGRDELHGESGNDHLDGGTEADKLYGDAGDDILVGGNGNDTLWGGKGNDNLDGFSGNDTLYGGDGNDWIRAYRGRDTVYGGDGDDNIFGGMKVDGGAGNDHITTGIRVDADRHIVITGGDGADSFEIRFSADGRHDVVEVTDLSPDDTFLDAGILIREGVLVDANSSASRIDVQGHDLVVVTIGDTDGDQLIIRGAADWLHVA